MKLFKPKILIGDDHGIIRKGLSLLIRMKISDFEIAEAGTCSGVMAALHKTYFTHLILDIIFPDGTSLEILPNVQRLYPYVKILIFSMQPAEVHGAAISRLGIPYYLSKTDEEETIIKNLRAFLNNEKNPPGISAPASPANPFRSLSARELQVLHYILTGLGTKEMAALMNLKMSSVSTMKKRIFQKTNCSTVKALADLSTAWKINY